MTKTLKNTIALTFLAAALFSCGAPAAEESVTSDTTATEPVSSEPSLDVKEDPITEKDGVKYTAEASPEHINAEKLAEPEVLDAGPVKKPALSPPAPKKPATDVTRTEEPEVKETPAPTASGNTAANGSSPAPAAAPTEEMPEKDAVPDHSTWNTLLQQHVNNVGNVNYTAFRKDEAKLDAYLAELADTAPTTDWSRSEAMAYWINAYNAATVKLILKNWPVKSIMDLHGGKPWDVEWVELGGKTYSLNAIEHDILRPRYQDPRIHFAVNCAAASCPPLPNKAFTASNLNSLLDARARAFIRNPTYNTIGETVAVSKIFDWYGEDFGNLREYLNKYAKTPIPEGREISYKEYDWALNKQ